MGRRRSWARRVRRLLGVVAGVYVLLVGAAAMLQERFIFPRDIPGRRDPAAPVPRGWEAVDASTEPGVSVPAWLRIPPGAGERPVPAVVFFHGNAEVIDDIAGSSLVSFYERLGIAVLLMEYRGYGRAGGKPSQDAMTRDAVRAIDLLAGRTDIDPGRIVYYGRSLGGGVACAAALQRPPRAMILQSTFTSVRAMAGPFIPGFLIRHPFDNAAAVARIDAPILFMHGSHDTIVPCSHSERLAARAKQPRLSMQACGHNDFPGDEMAFEADIQRFLADCRVIP